MNSIIKSLSNYFLITVYHKVHNSENQQRPVTLGSRERRCSMFVLQLELFFRYQILSLWIYYAMTKSNLYTGIFIIVKPIIKNKSFTNNTNTNYPFYFPTHKHKFNLKIVFKTTSKISDKINQIWIRFGTLNSHFKVLQYPHQHANK